MDAPDPNKPENWVFQFMPSWPGPEQKDQTDKDRIALLKNWAEDFAEPWKSAFLWIPEDTVAPATNLTYWATSPWNNQNGTVTLAGDAAHGMPPRTSIPKNSLTTANKIDRGQGLNHSIQDVVNFVNAIKNVQAGEATLSDAVNAYDAELVKRGFDEVTTSVQSAVLLHDVKKLMQAPLMKQGYVKTELE